MDALRLHAGNGAGDTAGLEVLCHELDVQHIAPADRLAGESDDGCLGPMLVVVLEDSAISDVVLSLRDLIFVKEIRVHRAPC
jgi:hypothetical protein